MLEILSMVLVLIGLVFFFGAVVGLVRFPDFYTRMHAAGKGDTLSTMLILAGLALLAIRGGAGFGDWIVALKILAICLFIMITSPTSTHVLMRAGYEEGVKPWQPAESGQRKEEA